MRDDPSIVELAETHRGANPHVHLASFAQRSGDVVQAMAEGDIAGGRNLQVASS